MTSIFHPSKLRRTKHVERRSNFRLSKLHRKGSSKQRGNSSIFSFRSNNVISTSNRRRFDVLGPLRTELFIVTPVVIRFMLFESKKPQNPVKSTLKSSERLSITESVTRGSGQTI